MTTLREAAQQALEALHEIAWSNDSRWQTDRAESVIPALRDALAQQPQTPCDIAEDGVCEVIDCCLKPQILEALEIGYDSAQAEAAQYHAAMAGYRPERHAAMDADVQKIAKAITALRAALAQPEQEPVAWRHWLLVDGERFPQLTLVPRTDIDEPLYTHPPRREWRGLTDEDMEDLLPLYSDPGADAEMLEFARVIEAKLKEKNNA